MFNFYLASYSRLRENLGNLVAALLKCSKMEFYAQGFHKVSSMIKSQWINESIYQSIYLSTCVSISHTNTVTSTDFPWSLPNLCMQGKQWTVVATFGISKVTHSHRSLCDRNDLLEQLNLVYKGGVFVSGLLAPRIFLFTLDYAGSTGKAFFASSCYHNFALQFQSTWYALTTFKSSNQICKTSSEAKYSSGRTILSC